MVRNWSHSCRKIQLLCLYGCITWNITVRVFHDSGVIERIPVICKLYLHFQIVQHIIYNEPYIQLMFIKTLVKCFQRLLSVRIKLNMLYGEETNILLLNSQIDIHYSLINTNLFYFLGEVFCDEFGWVQTNVD